MDATSSPQRHGVPICQTRSSSTWPQASRTLSGSRSPSWCAGAALEQGKRVAMFLTKEAVRLALPGHAEAVACDGCPPLSRLFAQFADGGGELLACPVCIGRASSTTPR